MDAKTTEYQAVILAGGAGNRMYPLPEKVAKCLLPVGNRPLISYQLDMLEKAGFKECLVITTHHISQQVQRYFGEGYSRKIRCSVHVVEDYSGTADALRQIANHITCDFAVISGDVITDVNLLYIADLHRSHDSAVTFLFTEKREDIKGKGKKTDKKQKDLDSPECNYIGIEEGTNRVLLYKPKADVEEALRISKRLLSKHPHMTLHSQLEDAHVYIFSRWALDVLVTHRSLSSVQNELIPKLVKAQFNDEDPELKSIQKLYTQSRALKMSSVPPSSSDPIQCLAYTAPNSANYCYRVNTVPAYKRVNREVHGLSDSDGKSWVETGYTPPNASSGSVQGGGGGRKKMPFNVGKDCVVGSGVQIGNKSSIKKSVVGSHCKIGEKCRISNCVIMDHVVIEDLVNLSDTVICSNARVQSMSSLDNCEVGANYTVVTKTKLKKEQLSTASIMETED